MGELLVNSAPTKEFFIKMITKDVTVESCILDLIDNSIDAHKKQKKGENSEICINFSLEDDWFEVNDNCGGMSKDTALNVAFKFGNESERTAGVLGMYGIGMKRSIFKIGEDFVVDSKTNYDSFTVYMKQKEWLELVDNNQNDVWKFYFDEKTNEFENGVHIRISKLTQSIREYLKWPYNVEKLKKRIAIANRDHLAKDISIKINNQLIEYVEETLFEADFLKTYIKTINNIPGVKIKVIAGIGYPNPKEAGWTIVSNGRSIIEKNREELTGWNVAYNSEEDNIEEVLNNREIPSYHNDFARFRGYVFLYSDDSMLLPLNTTKDGIDEQHKIYRVVLREMVYCLSIILPKLREYVSKTRDLKNAGRVTPDSAFVPQSLSELCKIEKSEFVFDLSEFHSTETIKSIPVQLSTKKIDELKRFFDAKTNKALGDALANFVLERIELEDE